MTNRHNLLWSVGFKLKVTDWLQGIADIYDEIVETDKEFGTNNINLLLENLAGKNRANIAASILQNADMLRSVYEDSQDSAGSAQEELDKYLESIEGHMSRLTNAVQEFWSTAIDSEFIKTVLDFVTSLINGLTEVVDILGGFPTLIGAITAGLSIKNGGGRAGKHLWY